MRLSISSSLAVLVAAAGSMMLTGWAWAPAVAGPLSASAVPSATPSAVELVGHRYRRYDRYDDNATVNAPFTYVETRHRRVAVDAPLTSVRVGRRGTWVRAPFVDIFVPR